VARGAVRVEDLLSGTDISGEGRGGNDEGGGTSSGGGLGDLFIASKSGIAMERTPYYFESSRWKQ